MQITRKPETIALDEQLRLVISKEIMDKIKFLCRNISKVEWSGVLFYKVHGSIKDTDSFHMEVMDIFLMDKGNKTYTEYTFDGDIADFMMEKIMSDPDWAEIKMGHVHSHNSMPVFFSGTDNEELLDNCLNHSYYLSLIVNNDMEMTAKVACKTLIPNYTAYDEQGQPYELTLSMETPKYTMITYECSIERPPVEPLIVPTVFEQRLQHILKETDRKEAQAKKAPINNLPAHIPGQLPRQSWQGHNKQEPANWWEREETKPAETRKPFDQETSQEEEEFFTIDPELDYDLVGINEAFTCFMLRRGEKLPEDTIADALASVASSGENVQGLGNYMVDNFISSYEEFFNEVDGSVMEDFLDVIEAMIENLVDFEQVKYAFISDLTEPLREFAHGIENAWREKLYPINS